MPYRRKLFQFTPLLCIFMLHACSLPPIPFLEVGPSAGYPVSAYTAVGDSITAGAFLSTPDTQAYPAVVAIARRWVLNNYGIPADMACDLFPRQIIPHRVAFTSTPGQVYSILIGTNDSAIYGIGPYQTVYGECQLAAMIWLATRPEDKVIPGDTTVTATGACSGSSSDTAFLCSGDGSLDFGTFSTTGNPVYLWYKVSDTSSANESFSVIVDGSSTKVSLKPTISVATVNGSTSSVYLLRLPVLAGQHRLQVQTTTNASILAVASNRANKPVVVAVGDVPNQTVDTIYTSVATQLAYIQISRQNVATAISDGLDVRAVNDRDYMLATRAEMIDNVHPNAFGHIHLAQAFASQLP